MDELHLVAGKLTKEARIFILASCIYKNLIVLGQVRNIVPTEYISGIGINVQLEPFTGMVG